MTTVTLGKTGITTNKNAFGALPIQRVSHEYSSMLLKKAFNAGFTFFATARMYTDSEEKMGLALSDVRDKIFIATKTMSDKPEKFWQDLETSLKLLKTDYVDIYQFHNPKICFKLGDGTGMYEAMLEAKKQGKIRFIGITNHRFAVAMEALNSDLYDTLQFPFSYLSGDKELELVSLAKEKNIGFIAMKALAGGLLSNSAACYAWLDQYKNALPIWGIQKETELDEFIGYIKNPPTMTDSLQKLINDDREELCGSFCRACGYCMPCPVGIEINTCARMSQLIRRAPSKQQLTEEAQAMMAKIKDCINCLQCSTKCPYGLDTPTLLKKNLKDYESILSGKIKIS